MLSLVRRDLAVFFGDRASYRGNLTANVKLRVAALGSSVSPRHLGSLTGVPTGKPNTPSLLVIEMRSVVNGLWSRRLRDGDSAEANANENRYP